MEHSTSIPSLNNQQSLNNSLDLELEETDLESLRLAFDSEDLSRRKPHELRELWMEKAQSSHTKDKKLRMPRFLLDPKNKDHIAPHTFALQLLLRRKSNSKRNNGDGLYTQVPSSEERNPSNIGHDNHDHTNVEAARNQNTQHSERNSRPNLGIVWHTLLVLVAMGTLACQFVLEVMGGAGAIWGCAELVRLRRGGRTDPSFDLFSWVALGIGICCLVRFFLVHPFFLSASDPTFSEKHKLGKLLSNKNRSRLLVFLELSRMVASDPVLFLHPSKGHACCGCYCVSSLDLESDGNDTIHACRSSESLGKSSPQRSTWELSDDEFDDCEFDNTL